MSDPGWKLEGGIYRAQFDFNGQSNVATVDSLEHCAAWLQRWTGFLVPRMSRGDIFQIKELVAVGSLFPGQPEGRM